MEPLAVSTGQRDDMLKQVTHAFGISLDSDLAVMRSDQSLPELSARLEARASVRWRKGRRELSG
jgi:UDP-N-acetylglucosamine 2-epimerase